MPMTTNVCKKHGFAHVDDKCPHCLAEEWQQRILDQEEFFKRYGEYLFRVKYLDVSEAVTVEDMYQHFRTRLFLELEPILKRMSRETQSLFETAYNAGAWR